MAAVADDMVVRAEMIRTADEQGWPASVYDIVADAAPGEEVRRRLRDVGGAGLMALTVLDRLSSGTEALMHLGRSVASNTAAAVGTCLMFSAAAPVGLFWSPAPSSTSTGARSARRPAGPVTRRGTSPKG